jgi:glutamate racemase
LGDNARAPYGNRTQQVIYQYTREAVDFLVSKGCSLIIIACNTASAEALRLIQQQYLPRKYPSIKVLGVIRPTVEMAAMHSKNKRVGVVGTRSTITSGAYTTELQKQDKNLTVYPQACPLLVPLIEEGWDKKPETARILKKYILPLKSAHIDTLLLGCTHYPLIADVFQKKMGKHVSIISSSTSAAEKLIDYLRRHPEVETTLPRNPSIQFYTTDDIEKFSSLGSRFLGKRIAPKDITLVHLPS